VKRIDGVGVKVEPATGETLGRQCSRGANIGIDVPEEGADVTESARGARANGGEHNKRSNADRGAGVIEMVEQDGDGGGSPSGAKRNESLGCKG
jgi:hypothetical protein